MIAPCPHRPPCPGCPRYGEAGLAAFDALLEAARDGHAQLAHLMGKRMTQFQQANVPRATMRLRAAIARAEGEGEGE